jgi:RNA polymerase sigma-70 factor, ECF subfamily
MQSSVAAAALYPGSSIAGTTRDEDQPWTAPVDPPDPGTAGAVFEDLRCRLFGIAYRVLGRAADAEDVVQDVWIRWQGVDRDRVRDQVAFLVTVTTRVALNAATSAHARREVSTGDWMPKRGSTVGDPALVAERSEELATAVQLLLERLSPVERAVYVLREAFGYPFREIADSLGIVEANARQIARRARSRLAEQRRLPVDPAECTALLDAFSGAARTGDMAGLFDLLTGESRVTKAS